MVARNLINPLEYLRRLYVSLRKEYILWRLKGRLAYADKQKIKRVVAYIESSIRLILTLSDIPNPKEQEILEASYEKLTWFFSQLDNIYYIRKAILYAQKRTGMLFRRIDRNINNLTTRLAVLKQAIKDRDSQDSESQKIYKDRRDQITRDIIMQKLAKMRARRLFESIIDKISGNMKLSCNPDARALSHICIEEARSIGPLRCDDMALLVEFLQKQSDKKAPSQELLLRYLISFRDEPANENYQAVRKTVEKAPQPYFAMDQPELLREMKHNTLLKIALADSAIPYLNTGLIRSALNDFPGAQKDIALSENLAAGSLIYDFYKGYISLCAGQYTKAKEYLITALKKSKNNDEARFFLAKCLVEEMLANITDPSMLDKNCRRRLRRAKVLLNGLAQLHLFSPDTIYYLGIITILEGDTEEARNLFDQVSATMNPSQTFHAAFFLSRSQDPQWVEPALSYLDTALSKNPTDTDCLALKYEILTSSDMITEKAEIDIVKKIESSARDKRTLLASIVLGGWYFAHGDYPAAKDCFVPVMENSDKLQRWTGESWRTRFYEYYGKTLAELGDADEALQYLKLATELKGHDPELIEYTAVAEASLSRFDEALAAIDRGIEAAPRSSGLKLARAKILFNAGRYQQAQEEFEALRQLGEYPADVTLGLAYCNCVSGDFQSADALVGSLGSDVEISADLLYLQGALHENREVWQGARTYYQNALNLDPLHKGAAFALLRLSLEHSTDMKADLDDLSARLNDSSAVLPDDPYLQYMTGYWHYLLDELDQALNIWNDMNVDDDELIEIIETSIGMIHYLLGQKALLEPDLKKACDYFDRCPFHSLDKALSELAATAYVLRGLTYLTAGDKDAKMIEKCLKKSVTLAPDMLDYALYFSYYLQKTAADELDETTQEIISQYLDEGEFFDACLGKTRAQFTNKLRNLAGFGRAGRFLKLTASFKRHEQRSYMKLSCAVKPRRTPS